jgi:LAO/AO transport system kinase
MKPFFVYMLRCSDDSYYTGHTDDLQSRVAMHHAGEIPGYTHDKRPVELVWSQETATREEALAAELRIKGWGRSKKEALIRGDWSAVRRHAWGTKNPLPAELLGESPSIPQGERDGERPSIPQGERDGERPSIPQGERDGESPSIPHGERDGERPSIPQGERHGESPSISQGERDGESPPGERKASPVRPEVSKDERALAERVSARDRRALAKAITLVESTRADHRAQADALLDALMPDTGRSLRIGISGVPGVGKSTFIETLGLHVIAQGHRVAVLAVDPSSSLSGGSILGDKTRMERLSVHASAFIRPTPTAGALGGVAEHTREALLLCEAAGFDVVIVETVGVGQSETAVAGMTDLFVLLQLPNAGDDLQAIKRGVMEIADMVVINKADLDRAAATRAQAQVTSALHVFGLHGKAGHRAEVPVLQASALEAQGIDAFWAAVQAEVARRRAGGAFDARRREQAQAWMWDIVRARLAADFRQHAAVSAALSATIDDVNQARVAPSAAARRLLSLFEKT